jgi:asparagine synthase (glutamine-hydrolysing)
LSGGLDSSICAAALAASGADWHAVTLVTPGDDGNERRYAQLVADHFGAGLTSICLDPADFDFLGPLKAPEVRPSGFSLMAAIDSAIGSVAGRLDADTLCSGTGGDNVFCFVRSAVPVLDRFRREGLCPAWRTMHDVAALTGADLWSVARAALGYWYRERARPIRWVTTRTFLANPPPPMVEHPWLTAASDETPGFRAHLKLILRARSVVDGASRGRERTMLFPLLSQPVMEACFAIPAWEWVRGGRDRAPARAAFADDLPVEIVRRRSKGRLESLLLPAYTRQRTRIVERLIDGRLAGAGLLDREALASVLRQPVAFNDRTYFRVLELLDAELWASAWS